MGDSDPHSLGANGWLGWDNPLFQNLDVFASHSWNDDISNTTFNTGTSDTGCEEVESDFHHPENAYSDNANEKLPIRLSQQHIPPSHQPLPSGNSQIEPNGDDSWDEDDQSGDRARYYCGLRKGIERISQQKGDITTAPLSRRTRHATHLMASANECSHMTLDSATDPARDKRMLVSSDMLAPPTGPSTLSWSGKGTRFNIIPKSIVIKNVPSDLSRMQLRRYLDGNGAQGLVDVQYVPEQHNNGHHVAEADFLDEDLVANFVRRMQHAKLRPTDTLHLRIDYKREPATAEQQAQTHGHFVDSDPTIISHTSLYPPDHPAEASLASSEAPSGHATDGSTGSTGPKKRKRHPRVPHGYACEHPGCSQTFDWAGSRTKHAKSHTSKADRTHQCWAEECDQACTDRRDLERHMARMHPEMYTTRSQEERVAAAEEEFEFAHRS